MPVRSIRCGQEGHFSTECRNKIGCAKCGQSGHMSTTLIWIVGYTGKSIVGCVILGSHRSTLHAAGRQCSPDGIYHGV